MLNTLTRVWITSLAAALVPLFPPPPVPASALRSLDPPLPPIQPVNLIKICPCFLAVLALFATSSMAADSQELGPLCAGLAQQMNVPPNLVKGFIDSQPVIPSEGFCPW